MPFSWQDIFGALASVLALAGALAWLAWDALRRAWRYCSRAAREERRYARYAARMRQQLRDRIPRVDDSAGI